MKSTGRPYCSLTQSPSSSPSYKTVSCIAVTVNTVWTQKLMKCSCWTLQMLCSVSKMSALMQISKENPLLVLMESNTTTSFINYTSNSKLWECCTPDSNYQKGKTTSWFSKVHTVSLCRELPQKSVYKIVSY